MSWIDYTIIIVVLVSVALSFWRGFISEALSLASWVVAFWLASTFSPYLASVLPESISATSVRLAIAFALLFVVTLFMGSVINYLLAQVVKVAGLSGTDRSIGMIFGLLRGLVIITVLVLLAGMTPMPQDNWWQESFLLPYFQAVAIYTAGLLPAGVAESVQY